MNALLSQRYAPHSILLLTVAVLVLVSLIPPEASLGPTIRIVLLHGALARAGLVIFAAAGALGLVLVISPRDRLGSWTFATQITALAVWLLAALTSAIATYLSWGVVIAWGEPRTQGTAMILALCVVMIAVVRWVRQHRFTGLTNFVVAIFAWLVVSRASSIQHPEDPVGTSSSSLYQGIFIALVIILVATAVQLVRWIHRSE